jgi:hypothetical protein
MLMQFVVLGIYKVRDETRADNDPDKFRYHVIVDGELKFTRRRLTSALLDLAAQIDAKVGPM